MRNWLDESNDEWIEHASTITRTIWLTYRLDRQVSFCCPLKSCLWVREKGMPLEWCVSIQIQSWEKQVYKSSSPPTTNSTEVPIIPATNNEDWLSQATSKAALTWRPRYQRGHRREDILEIAVGESYLDVSESVDCSNLWERRWWWGLWWWCCDFLSLWHAISRDVIADKSVTNLNFRRRWSGWRVVGCHAGRPQIGFSIRMRDFARLLRANQHRKFSTRPKTPSYLHPYLLC